MSIDITAYSKKDPIEAEGDRVPGVVEFELTRETSTLPLHVVFCIDTSGSMRGSRIETARRGLARALDEVGPDDHFAVCGFDSSAAEVAPPTDGAKAQESKSRVQNLRAGGGTNIMKGVKTSKKTLERMPNKNAIRWIVLITDGGAPIDEKKLEREFGDEGIAIYTAGIGEFNEKVVKGVAERTQGEWEYISDPPKLQSFFKEKVSEARNVVAVDPKLELIPTEVTTINDIYYTHGDQQSTLDPEVRGDRQVISLSDLNVDKRPTVRLDLEVEGAPDLEQTLVDAVLETRNHRATDSMVVEIAPPFIAEEKSDDSGMKDLVVAEVMETALDKGPEEAARKLERHKEDSKLEDKELEDTEEVLESMKKSGEAQEEASRMLSRLDDEE